MTQSNATSLPFDRPCRPPPTSTPDFPVPLRFSPPSDASLEAPPTRPRDLLRHLSRSGRALRHGRSHWLSFLPEIATRELWRIPRAAAGAPRYRSLTHYALVVAGVGASQIARVLSVWRRVGREYPVLWREFRRGAPLSALDRIAASVRDEADARDFAARIRSGWSVRDLETFCKDRRFADGAPPRPPPGPEAGASPGSRRPESRTRPLPSVTSQARAGRLGAEVAPGGALAPQGPAPEPPAAPGCGLPASNPTPPPLDSRRLEVCLSELDETLLRDLMELAGEGAGLTVGEYIGRLLRGRVAQRVARSRPELARVQGDEPDPEPSKPLESAGLPTIPQLGTALRYILVVRRDADRDELTVRTRHGYRSLPAGVLKEAEQIGDPIDLQQARDQALISAARSRGRDIPPLVLRYVMIRSQGRCEAIGCHALAEGTHHDERRAWKLDHHPDRVHALCKAHHDQDHLLGAERSDSPHAEADAAFRRIRRARRET